MTELVEWSLDKTLNSKDVQKKPRVTQTCTARVPVPSLVKTGECCVRDGIWCKNEKNVCQITVQNMIHLKEAERKKKTVYNNVINLGLQQNNNFFIMFQLFSQCCCGL